MSDSDITINGKKVAIASLPADHPARSRHHEGGYRSEEEYLYETVHFPGRPEDMGGYPGQDNPDYQQVNRVDRGKEYDDTNG